MHNVGSLGTYLEYKITVITEKKSFSTPFYKNEVFNLKCGSICNGYKTKEIKLVLTGGDKIIPSH